MAKLGTQDFLEIDQIKEGIVVLKNKGLRIVLAVSSLNFELKSDEEQRALLYQFQQFLNSLDFSCQVVIQSRRLNIVGYLDKLKEIEQKEENELLKIQIADYKKFIESILAKGEITQKTFYVIVPFALGELGVIPGGGKQKSSLVGTLSEENFQRCKTQLLQRVEFIALGLKSCGLTAIPLNNLELIELFWGLHHPQEAERGYYPEIPPELIS